MHNPWVPSNSKKNMSMKVNGRITKEMAEECSSGRMVQSMRATGRIMLLMALVASFMLMEMFTLENGLEIEHLEREFIIQLVVPNIRVNGRKISNMDMDNRHGPMKQSIKESIKVEKNMEKVLFFGKMTVVMRDSLLRIIFTDLENMFGKMEEFMKDSGRTTKWREKVFLPGLMVENMKDNTRTIRRKALVSLHLETVEFIKENGRMANSTARVYSARKI